MGDSDRTATPRDGVVSVRDAGCLLPGVVAALKEVDPERIAKRIGSLFLLVGWMLWKEGNSRTFGRQSSTSRQLLRKIIEEANIWVRASYKHVQSLIEAL